MKIGMLWYDNDKNSTFAEKCNRAIAYYTSKYGRRPTAIHVNPKTATTQLPGIAIIPDHRLQPNHFLIGVEE